MQNILIKQVRTDHPYFPSLALQKACNEGKRIVGCLSCHEQAVTTGAWGLTA